MAISFIGSASNSASPNGTYTVTLPGSLQADDLIIVTFAVGDSPGADNNLAGTGYTEVADLAQTGDTNDTELWVGYRYFVVGDTTAPTAAWTAIGGTNASNASVLQVFRGVATAAQGGPFTTAATTATGQDTSNADPPSIATAAGDWVVVAAASGCDHGSLPSWTLPTNYTTDGVTRGHTDTIDVVTGMGYRSTGLSNPENPGTFTGVNVGTAANNSWCAVTMALMPAPVAAPKIPRLVMAPHRAP